MKFKRFFCLFLLLFIVLLIFSSCNFSSSEESEAKNSSYEKKLAEKDKQIEDLKQYTTTFSVSYNVNSKSEEPTPDELPLFDYKEENGNITITKYNGKDENVEIPAEIDGKKVVKIGKNAFAETKIKSVIIPDGVEEIDWFAFYTCYNLKSVTLPNTVKSIGYGAFDGTNKSLVIKAEKGSYAEKFADSFGIKFEEIVKN